MLFNSFGFIIFLPLVVIFYYSLTFRWRNMFLLGCSYLFYIFWNIEFVLVLISATMVSYWAALKMGQKVKKRERKVYLIIALVINLGMLVAFKYLGFFTDILNQFSGATGCNFAIPFLYLMLPVGISFYTFQTLGYAIDVYRGVLKPEQDAGRYALFVSFFPLVLAGPIERGRNLLPQISVSHPFDPQLFTSGLRLMLWGMFKKVVIADRLIILVQPVFEQPGYFHGPEIAFAVVLKIMQVYADFSGYTDIAIGSARLLGFRLSPNFNRPFTAQSIAGFWSRWHISLTSWLRDYVYFSLPFKYHGKIVSWRANLNLLITFILVGFWHGPYWNFIIFGFLHGLYMIMANITKPWMTKFNQLSRLDRFPRLLKTVNITVTFLLVCSTGFFFGQHPFSDSLLLIKNLADFSHSGKLFLSLLRNNDLVLGVLLICFMLFFEYLIAAREWARKFLGKPIAIRYAAYLFMLFFMLFFGVFSNQKFFYFQF